jgi:Tfp pilus assembly pilus retraction ATPase PilT
MNINQIFEIAIKNKASDVHLVHGLAPVVRIDGELFVIDESNNVIPLVSVGEVKLSQGKNQLEKISDKLDSKPKKGAFTFTDDLLDDERIITSSSIHKLIKEILNEDQLERFYREKDYDISHQFDGARFRINLSYERGHFKMVARIIPEINPTLEDIDMPEKVKDLLNAHQGLILLTGPTGCGKSTSLAAMIDYIRGINPFLELSICPFPRP